MTEQLSSAIDHHERAIAVLNEALDLSYFDLKKSEG